VQPGGGSRKTAGFHRLHEDVDAIQPFIHIVSILATICRENSTTVEQGETI
jgi:hypothetical protein